MNIIKLIWLPINDMNSAKIAITRYSSVIFGLSVLSTITLVLSFFWITIKLNKPFSIGHISIGIISIAIYLLIGVFIKQNNRIASILPILLMATLGTGPNIIIGAIEITRAIFTGSTLKSLNYSTWYGILSAVVLLVVFANGVRGAFLYHKYLNKQA